MTMFELRTLKMFQENEFTTPHFNPLFFHGASVKRI